MALSGLDIYKLLPKTNCRECGFATCLAFAMQLAKKAVALEKCPHVSAQSKAALEAASQPPVRLVAIGGGEQKISLGNETVMFRHEEKFRNPCAIGFIIEDNLSEGEIKAKLEQISRMKFERVGQKLEINLAALRQHKGKEPFMKALRLACAREGLNLVLMARDLETLKEALGATQGRRPLVYPAAGISLREAAALCKEFNAPLVASGANSDELAAKTAELKGLGVEDLILDGGCKPPQEKIWELTQLRRQALKKNNRALGYPLLAMVEEGDPYAAVLEAGAYICKYASIVLLSGAEPWQALALLTLRQNIYTDPQKPLQVEPKIYSVGQATEKSPFLVTTNFSLSYYTVLGEVEASKVPAHILSADTEGMSVLTAWAAEKFNAEKIAAALQKFSAADIAAHKTVIIPGYVAVLSGDLEEQSGWKVIVGPKEASGIPSFLKNL
jgi:acetyl-CoA decarbonylase/synthase complex subunit gamma